MNVLWLTALLLGGLVYTGFLLWAINGILKLEKNRLLALPAQPGKLPSISIIIAARNEEDWIGATLESLIAQDVAGMASLFEIIVVDDRSNDRTAEIVREFSRDHPHIRLIRQLFVPTGSSPKKTALNRGIEESSGRIILLTDADCRHSPGWARVMAHSIISADGMAIGQARFLSRKIDPLWAKLQALDFAAQGVLSAGLAAAGTPFNCSGASLGFTRTAFDKIRGWEGIENFISGDDELLMRKFHQAKIPVIAALERETVVSTRAPATPAELWRQRTRWGSKTLYYPVGQKAVLGGVFLFYLSLALTPLIIFAGINWIAAIAGLALKMLLDLSLLRASRPLYGDQVPNLQFILAELLHPPLVVTLAILGAFGSFEWKGSTYTTKGTR